MRENVKTAFDFLPDFRCLLIEKSLTGPHKIRIQYIVRQRIASRQQAITIITQCKSKLIQFNAFCDVRQETFHTQVFTDCPVCGLLYQSNISHVTNLFLF